MANLDKENKKLKRSLLIYRLLFTSLSVMAIFNAYVMVAQTEKIDQLVSHIETSPGASWYQTYK